MLYLARLSACQLSISEHPHAQMPLHSVTRVVTFWLSISCNLVLPQIVAGSMQELLDVDFGAPLHSLVIAGTTHPIEDEILERFRLQQQQQPQQPQQHQGQEERQQ